MGEGEGECDDVEGDSVACIAVAMLQVSLGQVGVGGFDRKGVVQTFDSFLSCTYIRKREGLQGS
jgi:hypothetical protein